MEIKKKIQLYKNFGFKVAFASFCSSAFRRPMIVTRWKDKVIITWLKKHYGEIIQKYRYFSQNKAQEPSNFIWSIWWQGEDNAPEIVKTCFASVRRHCGGKNFRVITKENFSDYIQIPEHILAKLDSGVITLTHLSDILRFYLLSRYGGMWLDATIFVTANIPDEIFEMDYYVIRHEENSHSYGVNRDRWITYLQAAKKNNLLCSFGYDFLAEYWKEKNFLIDYMLIDYVVELAYQNFPDVKNLLDSVPLNNPEIEGLRALLNSQWDENKFAALTRSTIFFKLTWKHKFQEMISGHKTFYGRIMESNF